MLQTNLHSRVLSGCWLQTLAGSASFMKPHWWAPPSLSALCGHTHSSHIWQGARWESQYHTFGSNVCQLHVVVHVFVLATNIFIPPTHRMLGTIHLLWDNFGSYFGVDVHTINLCIIPHTYNIQCMYNSFSRSKQICFFSLFYFLHCPLPHIIIVDNSLILY